MTVARWITYICATAVALLSVSCSSSRKAVSTKPHATQEIIFRPSVPDKPVSDGDRMSVLISEAHKWIGTRYCYGGSSLNGTDCSGMVMELYRQVFDIKLPRSSREQQKYCKHVDKDQLRKGDLLFFSSSKNSNSVSHVGLYIGNDEMIHASSSRGVIISKITDKYYTRTYHSSGRVVYTASEKPKRSKGKKTDRNKTEPQSPATGRDTLSIRLEDLINTKIDSIYSLSQPDS